MANLATVHAFRGQTILAQPFPSLGAVYARPPQSTRIDLWLGDILETERARSVRTVGGVTPARDGLMIGDVEWRGRIVVDPAVLVGKPVLKGTRLAVEFVIDLLANGWTYEQIRDNYPGVTDDDVRACLAYAKEVLQQERVFPVAQP